MVWGVGDMHILLKARRRIRNHRAEERTRTGVNRGKAKESAEERPGNAE